MAGAPDASSAQGWVSVAFDSVQAAGTTVHVVSAAGDEVATFTAAKDFQSLVYSSPDIESGQAYDVFTGGTASGASVGGLFADGSTDGAQQAATVTAGEHAGGMGGPGGFGGGRGAGPRS